MAKVKAQSEESKYIKRINEQLNEVSKLVDVSVDNPLITAWSRAIRESGLDFKKDSETNRYTIRNTAANREKVTELQRTIEKYDPKTVGQYSTSIKEELRREQPQAESISREAIRERINIHSIERKIQHMLDVIYANTGDPDEIGKELSALSKDKSTGQRDAAAIYNAFGRISDEFRRIQEGMLTEEEEQRAADLNYAKDFPWEK